jgi:hypothetical protein
MPPSIFRIVAGNGSRTRVAVFGVFFACALSGCSRTPSEPPKHFHLQEATITDIQDAIRNGEITTQGVVELYLKRIQAYNGRCVNEPEGLLGPITTIPNAGQSTSDQRLARLGDSTIGRREA